MTKTVMWLSPLDDRHEEELLSGAEDPEELYRREILPRKLDLYDRYVRDQSLWLDAKIMAQTFVTVIAGRARPW